MKRTLVTLTFLAAALPIACGGASTDPVAPPPPPPSEAVAVTPPATPPEPSPEEKKKAEEEKKKAEAAKRLAEDRAKMEAAAKAEAERFTPELKAEAKKLAETKYYTLKAALDAVLAGKHRTPGHAERDVYRHPRETLTFFGLKPTMTLIEYGPGAGWYTELLAPTLAARGKLLVTTTDPKGPPEARSTFYAERLKRFLEKSPELYGKVETIVIDPKAPKLGGGEKADMVLMIRSMHGMHRDKLLEGFLSEVHAALKPGGVLGVVQHRAKPDANPDEAAKQGYLPEPFVIKTVEAAGFKLAEKSEVNANPKDTKDHPEGVWTLPPTLELGDKDRAKYTEIGESDRMTLKFVKVPKK